MKSTISAILFSVFTLTIYAQEEGSAKAIRAALNDFRYAEALSHLQKQETPPYNDFDYCYLVAQVYRSNRMVDSARLNFQAAAALDSQKLAPLVDWAQMEKALGNYRESIRVYHLALQRDTANAYLHRQLAAVYEQNRQTVQAIVNYQDAIHLQPNDLESTIKLGKIYIDRKAYELADQLCARALAQDSSLHQIWQLACFSAFRQKNYPAAWELGNEAFRRGTDSTAAMLNIMGVTAYNLQKLETAHLLLVRSLLAGQESEKTFFYLGQIAQEQGFPERAEAYFEKAIDAGTSEALGVYHLHMAFSLDDQEEYQAAITHYQEAYKLEATEVILYYLARDYDEAYRDKTMALNYYQQFLEVAGSEYYEYRTYSEERISELKKIQHFRAEERD